MLLDIFIQKQVFEKREREGGGGISICTSTSSLPQVLVREEKARLLYQKAYFTTFLKQQKVNSYMTVPSIDKLLLSCSSNGNMTAETTRNIEIAYKETELEVISSNTVRKCKL